MKDCPPAMPLRVWLLKYGKNEHAFCGKSPADGAFQVARGRIMRRAAEPHGALPCPPKSHVARPCRFKPPPWRSSAGNPGDHLDLEVEPREPVDADRRPVRIRRFRK